MRCKGGTYPDGHSLQRLEGRWRDLHKDETETSKICVILGKSITTKCARRPSQPCFMMWFSFRSRIIYYLHLGTPFELSSTMRHYFPCHTSCAQGSTRLSSSSVSGQLLPELCQSDDSPPLQYIRNPIYYLAPVTPAYFITLNLFLLFRL